MDFNKHENTGSQTNFTNSMVIQGHYGKNWLRTMVRSTFDTGYPNGSSAKPRVHKDHEFPKASNLPIKRGLYTILFI